MIRVWLGGSLAGVLALAALVPTAIRSQTGPTPAATAAVSPVQATKPIDRGRDDELIALLRRKVRYVFVIYQENRSFDSYFGTFPGADGLYSQPASQTRGFTQQLVNVDGSTTTISPFRIGPKEFAADTDDIDHSHPRIVAKMDIQGGAARMDQFALVEERKYSPTGNPSLLAKQFGELAMAHEDCDTVPFLWQYAHKFVLFDAMFQAMSGPSTPGNLEIIAAQAGQTQLVKHPDEAFT
ncbi:MAG: alkaline phosphatase family protein, partial [Vulcanimicrobiaceae bacterium]